MTISAKVIADSISPHGIRLTTMQVTMHRYVLAEFNTHRQFSRSFRSSRAVPVAKLLEEVRTDPAMPVAWLRNKPGMQATEPMDDVDVELTRGAWLRAANNAADAAELLATLGLHKQWANRGLEPYLYVHGVVTATEWANFFTLRRDKDAQPEMRVLADAMWEAREASTPMPLRSGQWHLPYVQISDMCNRWDVDLGTIVPAHVWDEAIKLSVARCARVSYLTFEGKPPNVEDDLRLYDRLVGSTPLHASPAEHQATPDDKSIHGSVKACYVDWDHPEQHGNFVGWRQYRKFLVGENVKDR